MFVCFFFPCLASRLVCWFVYVALSYASCWALLRKKKPCRRPQSSSLARQDETPAQTLLDVLDVDGWNSLTSRTRTHTDRYLVDGLRNLYHDL